MLSDTSFTLRLTFLLHRAGVFVWACVTYGNITVCVTSPDVYCFCQGYRVSAEQQIAAMLLSENSEGADLEMLRDAANNIFYQYLSEKVRWSHDVSFEVLC